MELSEVKNNLYTPSDTEKLEILKEFIPRDVHKHILDFKLYWDMTGYRKEMHWCALAIRFKPRITDFAKFNTIISLRPNAYWGIEKDIDGIKYHLFKV